MRNPERTKKRRTPKEPRKSNLMPLAPGYMRSRRSDMWLTITMAMAIARRPSSEGIRAEDPRVNPSDRTSAPKAEPPTSLRIAIRLKKVPRRRGGTPLGGNRATAETRIERE